MKLLIRLSCLLLFAAPALAEDPPRAFQGQDDTIYPEFPDAPADAPTARMRIVFDLVSRSQEIAAQPNVPFDAYVVAHDVQIALRGWEATLLIDERLTVLSKQLLADVNVGQGNEVFAAVKPRNCESGETIVLAELKLMLTEPATDLTLGLAPTARSSRPTVASDLEGPTPVYLVCRPETDVRPFDYCSTCAVVNPRKLAPERDEATKPAATDLFKLDRGRQR